MSFLFTRSKPKTPQEVVFALNELITRADIGADPKVLEEIHRLLSQSRVIAYGDGEAPPDPDQMSALSKEVYSTNILVPLVDNMALLSFEGRRDMTQLFTFLLQRQIGNHSPTSEYLLQRPFLVDMIIAAAGHPDTHRNANQILCEFAKQESLTAYVLESEAFWDFFGFCLDQPFEIASDCFTTFSKFLSPNNKVTSLFLQRSGDQLRVQINRLIMCPNYVIKRQAIRLQSSLINHRRNKEYISTYVGDLENLKMVMRLMKDRSKTIHYEAFHLFKVFAANPQKPQAIYDVLARNKHKLLLVLDELKEFERKEDELFKQERVYVIQRITELEPVR